MDVESAHTLLTTRLAFDAGRFFGTKETLALGVGTIYTGIRFPIYQEKSNVFSTAEGAVYVLTHECDIDPQNERVFNEYVLVCPIIDFAAFVESYREQLSDEKLGKFLDSLARREVSRTIYLPHWPPTLPYGGLLYFNQISNTHVSAFGLATASLVTTVTAYGLEIIDQSLRHHLLRPKAQDLPLTHY